MSDSMEPSLSWIYEGIWGVLASVFCVPRNAPALPPQDVEEILYRKPSPSYILYLKFLLAITMSIVGVTLIGGSIILVATQSGWFLLATIAITLLLVIISIIAYLAIHLRYDTMWYVFSDRSMRLRRGIWVIRESTITFENIQNVKVTQGPLQRWFGIADVVVETAGGGSPMDSGGGLGMHSGIIEGVAQAAEIRDSIMSHVRQKNTTGLGDELADSSTPRHGWSAGHIELLKDIRDLANHAVAT